MSNFEKRLAEIKLKGFDLNMNAMMSEAFKLYSKIVWIAGLSLVLLTVIFSILGAVAVAVFVDDPQALLLELPKLNPLLFPLDQMLIYTLAVSVASAIGAVFAAGLIQLAADADSDKPLVINTVFRYFTPRFFVQLVTAQLLIALLLNALSTGFQLLGLDMVSMGINWLISSLTALVTPLIIFGKLSAFSAIANSIALVNKQPLVLIATLLLSSFLAATGLLIFGIGFFFTMPYVYCVYYVVYKHITQQSKA